MSRCFPFPPPGYEKRPRSSSEQEELRAKEKHKEKKHKKEKRDKEQGESSERKDKDRSKDKHKEKKERKEKHKDKKRDKDKDKNASSSEQRNDSTHKAIEIKDSKFAEEFGRRVRDEEHSAANRMVENISNINRSKIESNAGSTSGTIGNESHTSNKIFANVLGTVHKRNDTQGAVEIKNSKFADEFGRRIRDEEQGAANHMVENIYNTNHRKFGSNAGSTSGTTGNESHTSTKIFANVSDTLHKRTDKLTPSFHQKISEGLEIPSNISERQKCASPEKFSEFTSHEKRRNDKQTPFHKRSEGSGIPVGIEKQKFGSGERKLTPPPMQKTIVTPPPVQKTIITPPPVQKTIVTPPPVQKTIVTSPMQKTIVTAPMQKTIVTPSIHKTIVAPPAQKTIESIDKKRNQVNHKVGDFIMEQKRNHVFTGRPFDKFTNKKSESICNVNSMQNEAVTSDNNLVPVAAGASRKRNDELDRLVESITSPVQGTIRSTGAAQAMGKESFLLPNTTGIEAEQKGKEKKVEDEKKEGRHKEKKRKEKDKARHKEKDKDRHKEKDKDRHREKKKEEKAKKKEEKMKRKEEKKHRSSNNMKESGVNDQINGLKNDQISGLKNDQVNGLSNKTIVAPHVANMNASGADGHKKRKEFEMNGFFHEPQLDERPNKQQKTIDTSSYQLVKNGKPIESTHVASKHSSLKLGSINNVNIQRGLDNNGSSMNGKAKAELPPPTMLKTPILPVTLDSKKTSAITEANKNDRLRTRPPHPDTKYLNAIYSVPKVEETPESSDQDWLYNSEKSISRMKIESNGTPPKVWAQGMQIEEADIFALPYVVPF